MNRPIRRVAVVVMIMFGLLLANGTYLMVFQKASLDANPQNRRVRDAEFAQDRGSILAGGGNTPIATTKPIKDRFKFVRSYPQGELYAPITGFYSYDHARSGLENSYNTQLAGTDDALFVRRMIDLITNQTPQGASVETTIIPKAQEAAAKALGNRKGAVVALDPQTGAVLALVTSPSYDPNLIAQHEIGKANAAYEKLINDPDKPMANRAVREIYPPGSTFKLVTAAAALEAGMKPDTKIDSPAKLRLPNTETFLPNQSDCGGSKVSIAQALNVSCNTAFANLGLKLGQDALREQADKFGFDAQHLTSLNGAASQFPENLDPAQIALSSIGQFDVAASPLQMAMVTAAIANDGVLMDPYVVDRVVGPDLNELQKAKPKELSKPMTPANAQLLQTMMVDVVDRGTGSNAKIPGVAVGGKTGTAQSDLSKPPYAWFTSFAPAKDAKVAVAVLVEEADIPRNDISGGRLAAPIARAVMEAVL